MSDYDGQTSMNIPKSMNIRVGFSMKNSMTMDNSLDNNLTVDKKAKNEQKKTDNLSMIKNNKLGWKATFMKMTK